MELALPLITVVGKQLVVMNAQLRYRNERSEEAWLRADDFRDGLYDLGIRAPGRLQRLTAV